MDQQKLNDIIEAACKERIKTPYVKAEITTTTQKALTINTEFNVNDKREAAALVACLASQLCENRGDYNMLITLIKKQMNQEKRREMAGRRK